jgi:hypothetical protein
MDKIPIKFLKELASKMPKSYSEAYYLKAKIHYDNRGNEFKNSFDLIPQCSPQIVSDRKEIYYEKDQKLFPINHFRRLKKAYQFDGYEGVKKYMAWVDSNNKYLNEKYKLKLVFHVAKTVISNKINHIL